MSEQTTAELLVRCLEAHEVEFVFGIPGAKIDKVFDALEDSPIRVILCRHEQNAAFMAAAYGRQTGKPGVVLVTSGPGVANLATGLLTATTEGDPIVALGGNVPQNMKFKESHQNTDNAKLLECVTKSSIEVTAPEVVPESLANAFRLATAPRAGACFISLPQNIMLADASHLGSYTAPPITFGRARSSVLADASRRLSDAKSPILLLGEEASRPENLAAINSFLEKHPIPAINTYQAAGVISQENMHCFYGRAGLFRNQPADRVLNQSDLVICVGFNPVEYDPEIWNADISKEILHIDYTCANVHSQYRPECELLGEIKTNLGLLTEGTDPVKAPSYPDIQRELFSIVEGAGNKTGRPGTIHPLRFVHELSQILDDDTVVCCDIGSVYMWLARYLFSHRPHQILFSNGQQTLGVGLPWGMATKLAYPDKKVISISGDGGFLFSAMELETAVREGLQFTHIVWRDGSYDMVKEQQVMKYHREASVELGKVDLRSFAEAFGAKGFQIDDPEQILPTLIEARGVAGPTLINVEIDYSDNQQLFTDAHHEDVGN
ncbi:acetolactate synthase AlsS [Puniceicoccus vermicola]|uniref:Acetolactate synthase AlsS n=1 Tax=Puniceicoccus vermicola TaxID=388746 RepID=A0A7X1E2R9_9BACT|nr:acetolactate synthase AlsS [Puniceicoccus vermicola]MBC2600291.1 acetolactate synthase AlsS [Puniceicoccus vermicola]